MEKTKMHELSITMSIISLVEEQASLYKTSKVKSIELEIGSQSGVDAQSLIFLLENSIKGTVMEQSRINISIIEAERICRCCGNIYKCSKDSPCCPQCSSYHTEMLKGTELNLKAITIE